MLEREVEAALVRAAKRHGGEVRKVQWIGRRGAPDRLLLLPNAHAFIELKRPKGGKLSALQKRELSKLAAAGFKVFVATTREEAEDVVAGLASATDR